MLIINGFQVDAELEGNHIFDSEITEHPVESGADVVDHVRPFPIEVEVVGIVSDTPIGLIEELRGVPGAGSSHAGDALAILLEIRENREPVTIETSLQEFSNMALMSLSIPTSAQIGDTLEFRARFRQIEFITNNRTTISVSEPQAARQVKRGNQKATDNFEQRVQKINALTEKQTPTPGDPVLQRPLPPTTQTNTDAVNFQGFRKF